MDHSLFPLTGTDHLAVPVNNGGVPGKVGAVTNAQPWDTGLERPRQIGIKRWRLQRCRQFTWPVPTEFADPRLEEGERPISCDHIWPGRTDDQPVDSIFHGGCEFRLCHIPADHDANPADFRVEDPFVTASGEVQVLEKRRVPFPVRMQVAFRGRQEERIVDAFAVLFGDAATDQRPRPFAPLQQPVRRVTADRFHVLTQPAVVPVTDVKKFGEQDQLSTGSGGRADRTCRTIQIVAQPKVDALHLNGCYM